MSVKQNLFVSVFVHKCLMMLDDVEYATFKMFVTHFLVIWGKKFQDSVVAKVFLVKLSEARTVTLEQLVAMSSPLNLQ